MKLSRRRMMEIIEDATHQPTNYYVDATLGLDTNSGKSIGQAWQTIAKVSTPGLIKNGDTVCFKCGEVWAVSGAGGVLDIEANYVTLTSYGSGTKPSLGNPGNVAGSRTVIRCNGNYITVNNLLVTNGYYCDGIACDGNYISVTNCEATGCKRGVVLSGTHGLITLSNVHDNVNTTGGYGALGIGIYNTDCEVSHNTITTNYVASPLDGGAIELYGIVDRAYIHHNYMKDNRGTIEAGSSDGLGTAVDVRICYNICINNDNMFSSIHAIGGTEAIALTNYRVYNNTVIQRNASQKVFMIGFNSHPATTEFKLYNNVFVIEYNYYLWQQTNDGGSISADYNTYQFLVSGSLGFTAGTHDYIAAPLVTNLTTYDLHIKYNSIAKASGLALGWGDAVDYDGATLGATPARGAYECVASAPATVDADTFTRADSSLTLGNLETGGAWTVNGTAKYGISSNTAYRAASGTGQALVDSGLADGVFKAVMLAESSGNDGDIYFRSDGTLNNNIHFLFYYGGGVTKVQCVKTVAGANTTILVGTTVVGSLGNYYELKVVAQGSAILLYFNGAFLTMLTCTDLLTNTQVGISCAGNQPRIDNFLLTAL